MAKRTLGFSAPPATQPPSVPHRQPKRHKDPIRPDLMRAFIAAQEANAKPKREDVPLLTHRLVSTFNFQLSTFNPSTLVRVVKSAAIWNQSSQSIFVSSG